ncbi:MAG: hypothetical protein ACYS6W_14435 [Planctomycetota bacterium]
MTTPGKRSNDLEIPQLSKEQIREMSHDEIIQYDPTRYILNKNQSIRDAKNNHRIVKPPPPEINTFSNPEKAREAITSRHQAAQRASLDALADLAADDEIPNAIPGNPTAFDFWKAIIRARAIAASVPGNPQGAGEARFVARAADLMPDPRQAKKDNQSPGLTINVDLETASRLIDAIANVTRDPDAAEPPRIIDINTSDPESLLKDMTETALASVMDAEPPHDNAATPASPYRPDDSPLTPDTTDELPNNQPDNNQ